MKAIEAVCTLSGLHGVGYVVNWQTNLSHGCVLGESGHELITTGHFRCGAIHRW